MLLFSLNNKKVIKITTIIGGKQPNFGSKPQLRASFKHTKDASIWNKTVHRLKVDFKIVIFHTDEDKSGNDKSTKV